MWRLAWPTVIQNMIGGLQGIVDHVMVGHYVGFAGNAAIGVGWQIFLVVIVFISSLFTGMGVLVARFAGANDHEKVNRVVYQAFLTAVMLALGILAPIGYVLSPALLELVHASPEVRAEALPYLRTMFVCSIGQLLYFMIAGALRAAGDPRTGPSHRDVDHRPERRAEHDPDPRVRPDSRLRRAGRRAGDVDRVGARVGCRALADDDGPGRRQLHRRAARARLAIIRSLFKFGLPAGVQGVAMNVAGVLLLRFMGSLPATAPKCRRRTRCATPSCSRSSRGRRWD